MPAVVAAVRTTESVVVASLPSTSQPDEGSRWHDLIQRLLCEDLEDRFELAHCSTELLLLQAAREESMLDPMTTGGSQVSPLVRRLALRCMSQVTIAQQLPKTIWYQAVVVLDAWLAARTPSVSDSSFLQEMPAVCSVVLDVLCKTNADKTQNRHPGRVENGEIVHEVMQTLGYDLPAASPHDLHVMEQSLLLDLQWQVNMPTVESWISMLGARFGVITQDLYAEPLAEIAEEVCNLAKKLVMWKPADWQRRPRRLAGGLLGIGLVGASLLRIEDLRPHYVYREEWEQLFRESQTMAVAQRCTLPPRFTQRILTSFVIAADLPLEEIQQDCEFAMRCLQAAAGAFHHRVGLAFAL